jgi:SAM-dependent methyltransferase
MGTAQVQGPLWGAAAQDWAELAEPVQIPFFEAAFDAIGVGSGTRLLDAGCGAGLALELAEARGAVTTGLDASAGLLAVARDRLAGTDLREGDLEELPYADDAFDAVTAFNSVQYTSDPTAALREIKRVAVPGALVAVTTWGTAEQCEMRAVLAAVGSLLPPPPPGAAGPFALAAEGALEHLVEGAGLTAERAIEVPTAYAHADVDTATRAHLSSGPARRAIETAGFEPTRAVIAQACETARRDDGSVCFDNVFKVLIARA